MIGDTLIVLIMTTILGGGPGNDLLSFIPTDAYWKAKDVQVTPANMMLELNSIKPDDTTKPIAVRRLMAIRALGELKSADAINSLNSQLDSKQMFVADYAQRAIDSIQGKPPKADYLLSPAAMKKDLYMLPDQCAAVGQIRFRPGGAIDLKKLLPQNPDDPSAADQKSKVDDFVSGLIQAAESTGNVRIDGLTIALSDAIGPNQGFFVMFIRGQYDHKAAIDTIKSNMPNSKTVGDLEFLTNDQFGVCAPSDDLFIMASGPNFQNVPLDDIAAALKSGKGKIESCTDLMTVIKTVDTAAPAWAALTVSDNYKLAPPLTPLTSMSLVGKPTEQGMAFTVTGTGADADGVKSAADAFTGLINDGKGELTHQAELDPTNQSLSDLVNSIEITTDGTTLTAKATMKKMGQ